MNDPSPTARPSAKVVHLSPTGQPQHVHDLARRLLDAYQVEGGQAHLAGCTLDDVPVVRPTWNGNTDKPITFHIILGQANTDGRVVDEELFETLRLSAVGDSNRPVAVSPKDVERLVEAATNCARAQCDAPQSPPDDVGVIWCKYARVKIQFTVGKATAQATFAGWAGTLEPQPFQCSVSGLQTFSVAATCDDRIVAADALATCELSKRKLPRDELVCCAATGKLIAEDLALRCPVSGEMVIESAMTACPTCRQQVSPTAIEGDRCKGCRRVSTVQRDDLRLMQVLSKYPGLANWKWLRLAETDSVFVVIAAGLFERRLLVIAKDTLEIIRAASGNRLSSTWTDMPLDGIADAL